MGEDQKTGGSSAGVVGGVLLALIVAVAAVFGVFYYRRRKEQVPIVNYATAADNANVVKNHFSSFILRTSKKNILHIFLLSCDQYDTSGKYIYLIATGNHHPF